MINIKSNIVATNLVDDKNQIWLMNSPYNQLVALHETRDEEIQLLAWVKKIKYI